MFPVRLGIVRQLCVPFVCRSSSGSMGDGDRTSRLTVGQLQSGSFQDFGDNCVSRVRKIRGFLPSSEQKGSERIR